jgi:PTH1 family peptidyl-tRNA hydrolase
MSLMFGKIFKRQPQEGSSPFLVIGLGNPGRDYKNNRHNIGFMLADRLAARMGAAFGRLESKALVAKGEQDGQRVILAKPQTFMNLSGQAASSLVRFYKIPLENLLVAYDDVDLPFGVLRLRPGGGSAGQKGMASIIHSLGSEAFPRLRLGIGRPPGRMEASDYVLQNFSKDQQEQLDVILDRAADAAQVFVTQGLDAAMNLYNGSGTGE